MAAALASVGAALASVAVNSLGAARWATGTRVTLTVTIIFAMAILIMFTIVSSSSEASASHGGGVGAGVGVRGGAGTAIRTDTMVTAIHTMATAMAGTDLAMVNMATVNLPMVNLAMVNMAMPANPELPNYSADYNARVITMDPLTESWGRKPGARSGHTNANTAT